MQSDFVKLNVSLNERLQAIEARVDTTQVRVEKLELMMSSGDGGGVGGVSSAIEERLQQMQKQIAELQEGHQIGLPTSASPYSCAAVVGGLTGFGGKGEAVEWIEHKFRSLGCMRIVDTYMKGDTFNGMLFVKFADKVSRDTAVMKFRAAYLQRDGKHVWAKADLPIDKRVPEQYLFGLKRVLVNWGFNKGIVRVDTSSASLAVAGEQLVVSTVVAGKLHNAWFGAWAGWAESHEAAEVVELGRRAAEALGRVGGGGEGLAKGHAQ